MSRPVWITFGALPNPTEILVINVKEGSYSEAQFEVAQQLKEEFGDRVKEVITATVNFGNKNPSLATRQLQEFFDKLGIPKKEHDKQFKNLRKAFKEVLKKRKK